MVRPASGMPIPVMTRTRSTGAAPREMRNPIPVHFQNDLVIRLAEPAECFLNNLRYRYPAIKAPMKEIAVKNSFTVLKKAGSSRFTVSSSFRCAYLYSDLWIVPGAGGVSD